MSQEFLVALTKRQELSQIDSYILVRCRKFVNDNKHHSCIWDCRPFSWSKSKHLYKTKATASGYGCCELFRNSVISLFKRSWGGKKSHNIFGSKLYVMGKSHNFSAFQKTFFKPTDRA